MTNFAGKEKKIMKITFLDAATLGDISLEPIAALGELSCYPNTSYEEIPERVKDCEVLIINKVHVDARLMDAAPKLRLICEAATGVNNIELAEAESRGIAVRNVAGYSTDSVAQLTFAHLLSLAVSAPQYDEFVKSGEYSRSSMFTNLDCRIMELAGKSLGIVGMGAIGLRVAEIASAFGMHVAYYSTSGSSHCDKYPSVSLEELMRGSDVISIHAPLNERTKGLIGAEQIAMMKPDAIIMNVGRGGIIDEYALAEAIDKEKIGGAAIDVFPVEPIPADHPLLHTSHPERLRLSPHIGWGSHEALTRLVTAIAGNIKKGCPQR